MYNFVFLTKENDMQTHYKVIAFSLIFYLAAQIFQQYVLLLGPLSSAVGLEETIIAGQHPLNYARYVFILFSMFLMVPGFPLLGLHFYKKNQVLAILAITFFLFFCLFEIAYRSVQLFQVMMVWGKEFANAEPMEREKLITVFQDFYGTVNAIYFPLLLSLFLGSFLLFLLSVNDYANWPVSIAMAVSSIQQLSRLSGYTPFYFLDIFRGPWYFLLVLITFGLLIFWVFKNRNQFVQRWI
jgi:hypothetical protein